MLSIRRFGIFSGNDFGNAGYVPRISKSVNARLDNIYTHGRISLVDRGRKAGFHAERDTQEVGECRCTVYLFRSGILLA